LKIPDFDFFPLPVQAAAGVKVLNNRPASGCYFPEVDRCALGLELLNHRGLVYGVRIRKVERVAEHKREEEQGLAAPPFFDLQSIKKPGPRDSQKEQENQKNKIA
jgi:hypothetical protein